MSNKTKLLIGLGVIVLGGTYFLMNKLKKMSPYQ